MMNWFKRDKKDPAQTPPSQPAVGTNKVDGGAFQSPSTSQVVLPDEPEYPQPAEKLMEPEGLSDSTPLVIIGVGQFGRAVLEGLAPWIPVNSVSDHRQVTLLSLTVAGEPESIIELPNYGKNLLQKSERSELRFNHGKTYDNWYQLSPEDDWGRPDGRLVLYQSLSQRPSAIWDVLERLLRGGNNPDVILVGCAMDSVSSGMIFDLAHLVTLVARGQNYTPTIGWIMATPNRDWGQENLAEAGACLRELSRLLSYKQPREYVYNPQSDNAELQRIMSRDGGINDAKFVFLCTPPPDLFGVEAAEALVARIDYLLLSLIAIFSNQTGRNEFLNKMDSAVIEANQNLGMKVSLFSVFVVYSPLAQLKRIVRARLAQDILFDRQNGILKAWSSVDDVDLTQAKQVLLSSGHPFLAYLANFTPYQRGHARPSVLDMETFFVRALRQKLEQITSAPDNTGFQQCAALLVSLRDYLTSLTGSLATDVEPLLPIIDSADVAMNGWLAILKPAREMVEETVKVTQKEWETSLNRPAAFCVLQKEQSNGVYDRFIGKDLRGQDIRPEIKKCLMWAWLVRDGKIELCLDVNPGKDRSPGNYRQTLPKDKLDANKRKNFLNTLWDEINHLIAIKTEQSIFWPARLVGEGVRRPEDEYITGSLKFFPDCPFGTPGIKNFYYQTSADDLWKSEIWTAEPKVHLNSPIPEIGILLQTQNLVPVNEIKSVQEINANYCNHRSDWKRLHIFRPEQIAAELESTARNGLDRRDQTKLNHVILSARTITAFQDFDRVELFVKAWLLQQIDPIPGEQGLQAKGKGLPGFGGDHPLDALYNFVIREYTPEQKRIIAQWSLDLKNERDFLNSPKWIQIRNGFATSQLSDLDLAWYVLVKGIIERCSKHD